jgi:hypothetical protein
MSSIIIAVAMLCQATGVSNGGWATAEAPKTADKRQLECQKWYVNCAFRKAVEKNKDKKIVTEDVILMECINERN